MCIVCGLWILDDIVIVGFDNILVVVYVSLLFMMFVVDKEVFGCCGVELLFVEVFECIEIFLFVELIVWVSS